MGTWVPRSRLFHFVMPDRCQSIPGEAGEATFGSPFPPRSLSQVGPRGAVGGLVKEDL